MIAPLQPVFTIPLAALALGERPDLRQVVGVVLAVAGIGAITAGRAIGVPPSGSRTRYRVGSIMGVRECCDSSGRDEAALSLLVWSSVVEMVPLLGLSLILEGTSRWQTAVTSIDASGIAALAYVVIASTFFGYGVWCRLISRHPASTVASFTLLVPVVGIFTAWLARGDQVGVPVSWEAAMTTPVYSPSEPSAWVPPPAAPRARRRAVWIAIGVLTLAGGCLAVLGTATDESGFVTDLQNANDVVVTDCHTEQWRIVADLEVTNPTAVAQDYKFWVSFHGLDGDYGTAEVELTRVPPGRSVTTQATSPGLAPQTAVDCDVYTAHRTKSR